MKPALRFLALAAALLPPAPLHAATPELAVYVTDQNEDVFVALYEGAAVELSGCPSAAAARKLLQLPAEAAIRESTLDELKTDFQLQDHPKVPCGGEARFDADWPATSPVWADLEGSGRYYLPAPAGGPVFYAIPAACAEIKAALAIRERIQLPGVLQGMSLPPQLDQQIVLDCGSAAAEGPTRPVDSAAPATWSLHFFDTFLSAESTGERIYVARFSSGAGDAESVNYLPIWRLDGRPVSEVILEGGSTAEGAEAALRTLFNLPVDAPVTALGAEAVTAIQAAVHVDLCLASCEGYAHRHALFASPGVDLTLTPVADAVLRTGADELGKERITWEFASRRHAVFAGCGTLVKALGLEPEARPDWPDLVEGIIEGVAFDASGFDCSGSGADLCIRRVPDGGSLTSALVAAGTDCGNAMRLRIELPAAVNLPKALVIASTVFQEIAIAPAQGVARSVVTGLPSLPQTPPSSCILSPAQTLIAAVDAPRLVLSRLDLRRSESSGAGEVVALQAERGTVALQDVTIGGEGAGLLPVERGLSLCHSELYAARSRIAAAALAVQGVASRLLVSGSEAARSAVAGGRFGVLLSAGSALRLHHGDVTAPSTMVLRSASLKASRSSLASGHTAATEGHALRLERGATAELSTSVARGFRCVGTFVDANATATFVLPGNNLAAENSHLSCGAGRLSVLE